MLNGFIAHSVENFWPICYDDPLLAWLGQRRFLEADKVEPELRQIIKDWPVGYIVVHQDDVGHSAQLHRNNRLSQQSARSGLSGLGRT